MTLVLLTSIFLLSILFMEYVWTRDDAERLLIKKHAERLCKMRESHAFWVQSERISTAAQIQDIETKHAAEMIFKVQLLGEKLSAERIAEIEKRAALIQDRFQMLMDELYQLNPSWPKMLSLIRFVKSNERKLVVYITEPSVSFDEPSPYNKRFSTREISLAKFSMSMALSEETPPEFVAEEIAEKVKMAVLQKWQSQSVLLMGMK